MNYLKMLIFQIKNIHSTLLYFPEMFWDVSFSLLSALCANVGNYSLILTLSMRHCPIHYFFLLFIT